VTAPEVVPCGHCGRPLTDPDSRALGYGPVCAAGVLGLDTHRTPVPRPRRRKNVNQLSLDGLATVAKGHTNVITIYGASDDTILVDGAIKAEFPCADTGDGVLLVASNGVVLRIQFETCWRIDLVTGRDLVQIVPCPEDDEDNYSDVATIPGDIDWVVCRNTFVTD
jgi:hypothetical protein